MKVLVDGMPLAAGGGVQVAIAVLDKLAAQSAIDWRAVVPLPLKGVLPAALAQDNRINYAPKAGLSDRLRARAVLIEAERRLGADVVFTVFGPAYFQPRAPHLVGFALPRMIYPREPSIEARFDPGPRLMDWMRAQSIRRATHLVVETEVVRRRLATRLDVDPTRISVVGNSVNPQLDRRPSAAPDDDFAILVPSAYYAHKNLEIIPRVAARIAALDGSLDFEFRLTLDPASPQWLALTHAAHRGGVRGRLVTLGVLPLDKLARAYEAASAVFLPTLREASTAVYPESFFYRRPLVTSDRDFARDLCGEAALFVDPLDVGAAARALVSLVRAPELVARLAEAGGQRLAVAYPSPEAKFAQQVALLEAVAGTAH